MPFKNELFDAVLCSLVLMGVPRRQRALKGMTRVVKPKGVVAASSPRRIVWEISPQIQRLRAFKTYISTMKPVNVKWFWHGFTVRELENLCRKARFHRETELCNKTQLCE